MEIKLSCPTKLFILGEYAVLCGLPAIVTTLQPRFSMHIRPLKENEVSAAEITNNADNPFDEPAEESEEEGTEPQASSPFHAESPAGKLLTACGHPRFHYSFSDPLGGQGGLGASTAQFALVYSALAQMAQGELQNTWQAAWFLYKKLTYTPFASPSGADLIAQWQGGTRLFVPAVTANADPMSIDLAKLMPRFRFLVFSATEQTGRKTATHEHLNQFSENVTAHSAREDLRFQWMNQLSSPLEKGTLALKTGDTAALGSALTNYANALAKLGLECEATQADRNALSSFGGVAGIKGCGAQQSDALLVLLTDQASSSQIQTLLAAAKNRNLKLVQNASQTPISGSAGMLSERLNSKNETLQ